jgi:hypothetical protein
MKPVYISLIVVLLISASAGGYAQTSSSRTAISEARQLHRVRQDFFNAIAASDYQGMRDQCSPDFQLLEDGEVMTVEDLINLIKSRADRPKIIYSFEDIRAKIEGSNAWISYRNKAAVSRNDKTINVEWLESAVFEKKNGKWKMVLLHSTLIKPKE